MKKLGSLLAACAVGVALSACNPELLEDGKHLQPLSSKIKADIKKLGSSETAPLYIRIFKEEEVLEAWKQRDDGTYALLKTYPICAYSGEVGPKKREGDRQAPEGFYAITPGQMNPKSSYYLSFNLGYPNKYDRSYGRTGAHLMVHGSCSSRGCYAMEDAPIAEIYALGREAFDGGQRSFKVHAFPFRMTPENMAKHRKSEHFAFWQNLKNGYDHFQITKKVPNVEVCNRTYIFDPQGASHFNATGPCPQYTIEPTLLASLKKLRAEENVRFREAVLKLEAEDKEKQLQVTETMVDSQLDLLKRKQRLAEGKNPDGFFAGLLKGAPSGATSEPAQADANPGSLVPAPEPQSTDVASTASTEIDGETTSNAGTPQSNSFFSKLRLKLPFSSQEAPQAAQDQSITETAAITALPKARQ